MDGSMAERTVDDASEVVLRRVVHRPIGQQALPVRTPRQRGHVRDQLSVARAKPSEGQRIANSRTTNPVVAEA